MSGILALVRPGADDARQELLERLTQAMAYRGPDGTATWQGPGVGLGLTLRRTHTPGEQIDPAVVHDDEAGLHVVADARLDDRAELVRALRAAGARGPGGELRVDTPAPALILAAWRAWGTDAPGHLNGDFAFVVHDARRRTLFAARDPFGVKPLFVAEPAGGGVVVSNTLPALLAHPGVEGVPDEHSIADHILIGWVHDERRTDFADVRQVERGSWWSMGPEGVRESRWWRLPDPPVLRERRGAVLERFGHLLRQAVADRLPEAPHPAVLQLSGGLDSGAIACAAVEARGGPGGLPALTVGYRRLFDDPEPPLSRLAAATLGLEHIVHELDGWVEPIPGMATQLPDWARVDPGAWHRGPGFDLADTFHPWVAARGRVTLTGWDGDAVLHGDVRGELVRHARRLRLLRLATDLGLLAGESLRRRRPARIGLRGALVRRGGAPDPMDGYPEGLFDPGFEERAGLRERWRGLSERGDADQGHPRRPSRRQLESPVWSALFQGQDPGFTGELVEARHPFLDRRLLEFFLSLPPIPWCVEKGLLRGWLEGRLPSAIVRRPKQGLRGDPEAVVLGRVATDPLARAEFTRRLGLGPQDPLVVRRICGDRWREGALRYLDPEAAGGSQPWWTTRTHAVGRWLRRLELRDAPNPHEGERGDARGTEDAEALPAP